MPDNLPPSLLSRLELDNQAHLESLSTSSSPEDSIPTTRTYAQRRLLTLVPQSLDTLDRIMQSGPPRTRLDAALAVLDRNPATKDAAPSVSENLQPAIPVDVLRPLFEGLGRLFTSLQPEEVPHKIIKENQE